jgi:HPt (histidine-containing phosphotransfer) domain-containing protein
MVMNIFEIDPLQRTALCGMETVVDVCESVDLNVLLSLEETQLEGEPDLIVELIDLYRNEGSRLIEVMKKGLEDADKPAIKRAAHSLRGSSSNLGILQMALICQEMEKSECSEALPFLQELLLSLEREFAKVDNILLAERQRRTS